MTEKAIQRAKVFFQVFGAVSILAHIPPLQQSLKLQPREAQQLPGLVIRQDARTISLNGQRLAARIGQLGKVVRKLDSDLHGMSHAGIH